MKKKLLILGLLVGVAALAFGLFLTFGGDRLHAKARKQWKAAAISQIDQKVHDTRWLESELLELKKQSVADSERWVSENMILATNGDWIVCASKCSKEDWKIHDIFIGRASDGKWYYSTYHFCVGKMVLKMETQPASLKDFVQSYSLREFDGQSDECLKRTWPPDRK